MIYLSMIYLSMIYLSMIYFVKLKHYIALNICIK